MEALNLFVVISKEHRDLFTILREDSLASYVAVDLDSSRGISRVFKKLFGVGECKELTSPRPAEYQQSTKPI